MTLEPVHSASYKCATRLLAVSVRCLTVYLYIPYVPGGKPGGLSLKVASSQVSSHAAASRVNFFSRYQARVACE